MKLIAEPLREYYKGILKIGMAPWAKTSTMDMKDAYTDLVMEKVENGTKCVSMKDYKELFQDAVRSHQQQHRGRKNKQPSKIPIRNRKGTKQRSLPKETKGSSIQRQISHPKSGKKQGRRILVKADLGWARQRSPEK